MTVEIKPNLGDARALEERTFHFCCLGNFSGAVEEREDWAPRALSRNGWDALFEDFKPAIDVHVALPKVDDLRFRLEFRALGDFTEKGLTGRVPVLRDMAELGRALGSASKERPMDVGAFLAGNPELAPLQRLAEAHGEAQTLDLLSMVDIGDGEEEETLSLPCLKACLGQTQYTGEERGKATAELERARRLIVDQILEDARFQALHGLWRGLKTLLPHTGGPIHVSLIDCLKSELCDAVYLTFVKPERGQPPPLDLAFCCEELGLADGDRHIIHHLGRMAERLAAPFILNAAPAVFQCKTWRRLTHVRDIGGRLSGPAHVKWRKLRDEPGAHWLFMAVNPFLAVEDGAEQDAPPSVPACCYLALLMAFHLKDGGWPGELTGPLGRLGAASACVAKLSDEQGCDLAYEGFCGITGVDGGDTLRLLGMSSFASIKIPAHLQLQSGALVEFTLPYRFYSGCCSRFLQARAGEDDAEAKLRDFAGVPDDGAFQTERADGQAIYRFRAPFTVLGVHPDLILAIDA